MAEASSNHVLQTYRFMRTNAARALSNDNLGKFIYEHEVFVGTEHPSNALSTSRVADKHPSVLVKLQRADTPIEELSKVSPLPTQKSPRRTAGKQRTDSKRAPRRPRTSKPAAKRSRKPAKKKKAISRTILPRRRSSDTSTVSSGTSTGSSTGSVAGNASCGSLASLVSCTSNSCASSIFGSDREQNFGDNLHREDICGDTDDDDEDDTSISFAGTRSLREMLEPRPSSANTTPPSGGSSLPTQGDRSGSRSMSDSIHPDHTVTSPEALDETEDAFSEIFAASAGLEDRRSSEQFAPEISMPTEWPGDHGPHPTAGDDTFTATIEQEVKTPCGRDAMLGSICASANTITAEENQTISELSHLAVESLMDIVDEQAENASQEVIEYIDSCDNAISVPIDKIWATPEAFQVWVEGSLSLKGSLLSQPRRRKMFMCVRFLMSFTAFSDLHC